MKPEPQQLGVMGPTDTMAQQPLPCQQMKQEARELPQLGVLGPVEGVDMMWLPMSEPQGPPQPRLIK